MKRYIFLFLVFQLLGCSEDSNPDKIEKEQLFGINISNNNYNTDKKKVVNINKEILKIENEIGTYKVFQLFDQGLLPFKIARDYKGSYGANQKYYYSYLDDNEKIKLLTDSSATYPPYCKTLIYFNDKNFIKLIEIIEVEIEGDDNSFEILKYYFKDNQKLPLLYSGEFSYSRGENFLIYFDDISYDGNKYLSTIIGGFFKQKEYEGNNLTPIHIDSLDLFILSVKNFMNRINTVKPLKYKEEIKLPHEINLNYEVKFNQFYVDGELIPPGCITQLRTENNGDNLQATINLGRNSYKGCMNANISHPLKNERNFSYKIIKQFPNDVYMVSVYEELDVSKKVFSKDNIIVKFTEKPYIIDSLEIKNVLSLDKLGEWEDTSKLIDLKLNERVRLEDSYCIKKDSNDKSYFYVIDKNEYKKVSPGCLEQLTTLVNGDNIQSTIYLQNQNYSALGCVNAVQPYQSPEHSHFSDYKICKEYDNYIYKIEFSGFYKQKIIIQFVNKPYISRDGNCKNILAINKIGEWSSISADLFSPSISSNGIDSSLFSLSSYNSYNCMPSYQNYKYDSLVNNEIKLDSQYLITENGFIMEGTLFEIGGLIKESKNVLKTVIQTGEGDFNCFEILSDSGEKMARIYCLEDLYQNKMIEPYTISSIEIISTKFKTSMGFGVGSIYRDLKEAFPILETHGSEIESRTYSSYRTSRISYRLNIEFNSYYIDESLIDPSCKVIMVHIN